MIKEKILKFFGDKLLEKAKEIFEEECESKVKGVIDRKTDDYYLKRYRENLDEEMLQKYGDEVFYDDLCKALLCNDHITKLMMRCKKRDLMDQESDEEFINNIMKQLPSNTYQKQEVRKVIEYISDITFKCFNELENEDSIKLANITIRTGDNAINAVKGGVNKILENQNKDMWNLSQEMAEIRQLLQEGNQQDNVRAFQILDRCIREGRVKDTKELVMEVMNINNIVRRVMLFEIDCLQKEEISIAECSRMFEHISEEEIFNRAIEFLIMIKIDNTPFLQRLMGEEWVPDVYKGLIRVLVLDEWDNIVKIEREHKKYNIEICDTKIYRGHKEIVNYMIYYHLYKIQETEGRLSNFHEMAVFFLDNTNFINDLEIMRLEYDYIIGYSINISQDKIKVLNHLLDKVILQKELWYDIAIHLSLKYYDLYFKLLWALKKEDIQEKYLEIPENVQQRGEIKFYWILDGIHKGTIDESDIIDFALEERGYNALVVYCEINRNNDTKILDVLNQCKLLLKKDVNLFCFYLKALFNVGNYDEVGHILKEYREVYQGNLKYWNVCLSLKADVNIIDIFDDLISGKIKIIDFHTEEEFIEHLYNAHEFDKASTLINKLDSLQIESNKVLFIKADILLNKGRELEALEILKLLYLKNPYNIAIIQRIIAISINNRRKISSDILEKAIQICEPWSDVMVATVYDMEGETEKADFYITRGLLKCHSFNDSIYTQYVNYHLLVNDDTAVQRIKGIDINTAAILKSEQCSITICIFEKRYVTEIDQVWEGAKIIDKDKAIKLGLLRRQTGETVAINGNEFIIEQIMPADYFLVTTCFVQLENHNISKSFPVENVETLGQDISKWFNDKFPQKAEVNYLDEYINPKGMPWTLYVLHNSYPFISYSELIIALMKEKNIMIRNVCFDEVDKDSNFVLTYEVLIMLWKIGVEISDLKFDRIRIPSSIKKEAENEANYINKNVNRDIVARMNVIENQLFIMEDTEDVKRERMRNVTYIKEYIEKFLSIENVLDIAEDQVINSENIKKIVGICDYDAIAISISEKKCLVAEEVFFSYLSKRENSIYKVSNIVDFLVNMEIDCRKFIKYIIRLVEYSFEIFITKEAVEYIICNAQPESIYNEEIVSQWNDLLNMEKKLEKEYRTIFIGTLRRICYDLGAKYRNTNNLVWRLLLWNVCSWFNENS